MKHVTNIKMMAKNSHPRISQESVLGELFCFTLIVWPKFGFDLECCDWEVRQLASTILHQPARVMIGNREELKANQDQSQAFKRSDANGQ